MKEIKNCFSDRAPGIMGQKKSYSILVPLFQSSRGWELVFEKRAENITQPGEVSYPGGSVEPGETPADAALRETMEELGIPYSEMELWGPLDILPFYDGVVLYPYIGRINISSLSELNPNPDEVSSVFSVPLSYFMDNLPNIYPLPLKVDLTEDFPYEHIPGGKSYPWRRGKDLIRFYFTDDAIIWGLTARITENVVKIINKSHLWERR